MITLCMLVKAPPLDRLAMLLDYTAPVVGQVVCVVDTKTQITLPKGMKCIPFTWGDDFAAARNYALEQCTGDWVFVVSPDGRHAARGLRMVYEPKYLRFFQARFEPVAEE